MYILVSVVISIFAYIAAGLLYYFIILDQSEIKINADKTETLITPLLPMWINLLVGFVRCILVFIPFLNIILLIIAICCIINYSEKESDIDMEEASNRALLYSKQHPYAITVLLFRIK